MDSVAVVVNNQGQLARFSDDVLVNVYRRQSGTWVCPETIRFFVEPGQDLSGMRDKLRHFVAALGETRILLAASISGIAYSVLNQRGLYLCEMDSFSPDCLDALVESVNAPSGTSIDPHPVEISPGVYTCDLMAILKEYPDLTSKKILRPFFDKTPFVELRVACSHVPPWFEPELRERGLGHSEAAPEGGRLWLRIRPLTCVEKEK